MSRGDVFVGQTKPTYLGRNLDHKFGRIEDRTFRFANSVVKLFAVNGSTRVRMIVKCLPELEKRL